MRGADEDDPDATCSGILAGFWRPSGPPLFATATALETPHDHAATAQHCRPRRPSRGRPHRAQRRPRVLAATCRPRAATTSSPKSTRWPSATSSRPCAACIPDHGFLGEETGRSGGDEYVWIIDPLDGTTNFLHGFPMFAVSIAVEYRGRLEHAVVYDPMRQELFTASRGGGAQLDGRRIRVSKQIALDGALIGTGFPYRANVALDRRLHGDAQGGHAADGGHPSPRRGRARPRLRRRGPHRRVLGDRAESPGTRPRARC